MPGELIALTERFAATPLLVLCAICFIYVLLGCVLESKPLQTSRRSELPRRAGQYANLAQAFNE